MALLAVPNPRTYTAGEFVTAGELNAFRDAINFLTNPPMAVLFQTTAQSLTSGTPAAITMDNTNIDTYAGHSNASNPSRYTAQVAGWYWVKGQVVFAANATGDRTVQLYKNGAALTTDWNASPTSSSFFAPGRETGGLVQMAVGDYVEVWAEQTSGGALSTVTSSVTSTLQVLWVHV